MTETPPPVELTELDKFRALCITVLIQDKDVWCKCSSEREARSLRRKFYRLKDSLDVLEKEKISQIVFNVVGHRVRCSQFRQRATRNNDWDTSVSIGD